MEELKYQKIEDIKVDSKLVKSVNFKPKAAPIICGLVGFGILFINNILARILGVFFIVMAGLVLYLVQDKKTIDVYEKGCVIYNSKDNSLAYYLDFENVKEWDVSHDNGHDTIVFKLIDDNKALVDTFESNKAYDALQKVIPDKNYLVMQAKRNKEMNINPVDALKNIMNRKK